MEYSECAALLRERDNYLIITHKRPDGDTLGSAAALCHALRRLGKTAHIFRNEQTTEKMLPRVEPFFAPEGYVGETTVSVDVADETMFALGFEGDIFLKIDHHLPRSEMGLYRLIHPECAACGEIVLKLMDALELVPDKTEADLLYIAISTDTGCFLYANTSGDTHRAVGRLLDLGADLPGINKLHFRTKTRARLMLEGMVYSDLRSYRSCAINIAVITLDMLSASGAVENDLDDLANLAGQVEGSRVSITVRELSQDPPRCKISLRTDGVINACTVCEKFGGGGHRMASGCELPLCPNGAAEAMRLAVEDAWA